MSALSPVGATGCISTKPCDEKAVSFEAIEKTNGNLKEIRYLLQGDRQTGLELFKEALDKGNAVLQIQLSYALFGMKVAKDSEKDFSLLTPNDLESLMYYPKEFVLFYAAYDEATGSESSWQEEKARAMSTFGAAANHGYLPAILELCYEKWKHNTDTYGFAVQLRRYVGQGDKLIDSYFGSALKNGCQIGSPLYYEGIYWLEKSSDNLVKYPREEESFECFVNSYLSITSASHFEYDGFFHVYPSTILAPSKDAWETFLATKILPIQPAPLDSYLFTYDAEQIRTLMSQYKITGIRELLPITDPMEEQTIQHEEEKMHRFYLDVLTLYEGEKQIGMISVHSATFAIHQTFTDPRIQPVLDFVENILTRSGSVRSVLAWFRQI